MCNLQVKAALRRPLAAGLRTPSAHVRPGFVSFLLLAAPLPIYIRACRVLNLGLWQVPPAPWSALPWSAVTRGNPRRNFPRIPLASGGVRVKAARRTRALARNFIRGSVLSAIAFWSLASALEADELRMHESLVFLKGGTNPVSSGRLTQLRLGREASATGEKWSCCDFCHGEDHSSCPVPFSSVITL